MYCNKSLLDVLFFTTRKVCYVVLAYAHTLDVLSSHVTMIYNQIYSLHSNNYYVHNHNLSCGFNYNRKSYVMTIKYALGLKAILPPLHFQLALTLICMNHMFCVPRIDKLWSCLKNGCIH